MGGQDAVEDNAQVPAVVDGTDSSSGPEGMFKSFKGKFESAKDRAMDLGVNDIPYVNETKAKAKEGFDTAKEQTKKWAQFGVTHAGYAKDNATAKIDEGMELVVQPIKDAKDRLNKLVRVEPEWLAVGLGASLALMATRKGPRRMMRNGLLGTGAGIGGLYALSASEGK